MHRAYLIVAAALAFAVSLYLAGCEGAGGGADTGTVTGRVVTGSRQVGVGGAVITVGQGGPSATSDANGNYTVTGVPAGSDIPVFVTPPPGFEVSDPTPGTPEVARINVVAGGTTMLDDIILVPQGPPPPP